MGEENKELPPGLVDMFLESLSIPKKGDEFTWSSSRWSEGAAV